MPMNRETVNFLKKKGNFFFVKVRRTSVKYDYDKMKDVTEQSVKITTLQIFPNIVIYSHDFFREYKDETLIGYCPIEFEQDENLTINL